MKFPVLDLLVPFGPILRGVDAPGSDKLLMRVVTHALPMTFLIYWLFSFIPLAGTLLYALILVPLSAARHIKEAGSQARSDKAFLTLWYFTVIIIGFGGIWGFIGHTVLAGSVAADIGWDAGSPFQTELAFYHLGFGIAGLMAIQHRDQIITGLVIAKSIFWYGAALVHIEDMITNKNFSPSNVGAPLIGDIILPTVLLALLFVARRKRD